MVTLDIPPLRDRIEDIPGLAQRFFDEFNLALSKDLLGVDPAVIRAFTSYDWPGNVRELINVMERAVLLASGETVTVRDIPSAVSRRSGLRVGRGDATAPGVASRAAKRPTIRAARREAIDAFERAYLTELLAETHGRVGLAARRAGISPRALFEKLKRLKIDRREFADVP